MIYTWYILVKVCDAPATGFVFCMMPFVLREEQYMLNESALHKGEHQSIASITYHSLCLSLALSLSLSHSLYVAPLPSSLGCISSPAPAPALSTAVHFMSKPPAPPSPSLPLYFSISLSNNSNIHTYRFTRFSRIQLHALLFTDSHIPTHLFSL